MKKKTQDKPVKQIYDLAKDKVRLFGIGRTGSTLIWNICRILEVCCTVQDRASFSTDLPVICTYRDWRDVIVSAWRVNSKQPSDRKQFSVKYNDPIFQQSIISLEIQLKELYKMRSINPNGQILYLQYERFYHDFEYTFAELERFLNIEIPLNKRFEILEECHIVSAMAQANEFSGFAQLNKQTRIHGQHIYYGMPGTWKYILRDPESQSKLTDRFAHHLQKWGYTL